VLFKSNHINKAVSAVMLVILLFIHSVKLLHTHSYHPVTCGADGKINSKQSVTVSTELTPGDCGICSYQLSKDADDFIYTALSAQPFPGSFFNEQIASFYISSFLSAFDSRGPPAVA
jgi:hypothetical protein